MMVVGGVRKNMSIRQARKPTQWLPFAQARDWARTLGLSSVTEWKAFRNRRTDVPANPHQNYAGYGQDFRGYPDWLGYGMPNIRKVERKARLMRVRDELSNCVKSPSLRHTTWNSFATRIETHFGFRFFILPPGCDVHVLFQPPQVVSSDQWVGMVFSVGSYVSPSGNQVHLSGHVDRGKDPSSVFLGMVPDPDRFLLMRGDMPRRNKVLLDLDSDDIGGKCMGRKYASCLVSFDILASQLETFYRSAEKYTIAHWLSKVCTTFANSLCRPLCLINELYRQVFGRHGYEVAFPLCRSSLLLRYADYNEIERIRLI